MCHSLTQSRAQLRIHFASILARRSFREEIFWHSTILGVNIHSHSPLTAIAHQIMQKELH